MSTYRVILIPKSLKIPYNIMTYKYIYTLKSFTIDQPGNKYIYIYNTIPVIYNELNTQIIYKIIWILNNIQSPLFSTAFYGGAAVSLWAECHPEVRTLEQEVQGIQGEEAVGQTSLHEEHCYRLPTADTSSALWSSLTLPRKVGGNERPGSPNNRL